MKRHLDVRSPAHSGDLTEIRIRRGVTSAIYRPSAYSYQRITALLNNGPSVRVRVEGDEVSLTQAWPANSECFCVHFAGDNRECPDHGGGNG